MLQCYNLAELARCTVSPYTLTLGHSGGSDRPPSRLCPNLCNGGRVWCGFRVPLSPLASGCRSTTLLGCSCHFDNLPLFEVFSNLSASTHHNLLAGFSRQDIRQFKWLTTCLARHPLSISPLNVEESRLRQHCPGRRSVNAPKSRDPFHIPLCLCRRVLWRRRVLQVSGARMHCYHPMRGAGG